MGLGVVEALVVRLRGVVLVDGGCGCCCSNWCRRCVILRAGVAGAQLGVARAVLFRWDGAKGGCQQEDACVVYGGGRVVGKLRGFTGESYHVVGFEVRCEVAKSDRLVGVVDDCGEHRANERQVVASQVGLVKAPKDHVEHSAELVVGAEVERLMRAVHELC